MKSEFFMAKGIWILKLFQSCLKQMKEFIITEIKRYRDNNTDTIKIAKTHYDLIGYTCNILTFIQDSCIRHGQYLEFKKWSSDIPNWNIQLSHSTNLCATVAYQPTLVPKMFKECPFKTNADAINFVAALIEHHREKLLFKYLGMSYGKQTINKFNSLQTI